MENEFIITDMCMWEKNKTDKTFHPHAIQVVDLKTGQVRFIKSGAVVRFIRGDISDNQDQTSYNTLTEIK